ncbi:MAG: hypothetical protein AB7O44_19335 [Hyphomicrobiaceae bacterium]
MPAGARGWMEGRDKPDHDKPRALGPCAGPAAQRTLGYACIVRRQAARHWTFVMCVARSQNLMQSASDLPPPPGLLGSASLGLDGSEPPGERAMLLAGGSPPPEIAVGSCWGSGATAGASGAGD